ncbi:MAG TPA: DeoR/GlpR family DNA-binding transcription regulator [Bacillus sp. (in: firmicutes)]|uniref:DeoR/GlpR family DNA-binding transcription regulator n=1 Tax=Bacillus litorisediminis TaxID=2922713 RepID=UPI001FAC88ED|nr:DeoR/GlpR family DNA-binding transcription regulator [Bacillus litorisediminis]HWO78300.1 DeoR/GlpR family DNA-binding transcription regulator [Bacillus sp. (in: firmicutes)]
MFSEERREEILKLLEETGRVLVKDLADHFNVSIDSIRRDLSIMEEKGLLQRTHGGAIPARQIRLFPAPSDQRYNHGDDYGNAIAKKAASFIKAGQTVFIGGASIHYFMLKYLPEDVQFTVVTNSLRIADVLRTADNIDCFLIGGKVKKSGNMSDAFTNEMIKQFNFDLAFLTGGALNERGLSTATPEVAVGARVIHKQARKSICLMGHWGFGITNFVHILPVDVFDLIITDEETAEEHIEAVRGNGGKVEIAFLEKE